MGVQAEHLRQLQVIITLTWLAVSQCHSVTVSQCHSVTTTMMDKLTLLLLVGGTFAQNKFYRTKFDDCGSLLDIAPALQGSVQMTAPFNKRTGRHILGKVDINLDSLR